MPTTGDWRNWTEADKVAASLEELAAHEPMGVELLQKALAADHTVSRLHAYAEGSIFLERLHGRTMARYLRDRLRLLSLFETPERILEIANVVYSSHPRSFHEGQKLFQKLMLELLTQYVLLDGLENMHGEERLVLDSRPLRELVQEDPLYGSGLAQQRLHALESIFVDAKHLGPKRDGQDQQPNSAKISESFSAQYRKLVASRFPTERIVSIVEAYTNALLEWLGEPPLSAMIAELDRTSQDIEAFSTKEKHSSSPAPPPLGDETKVCDDEASPAPVPPAKIHPETASNESSVTPAAESESSPARSRHMQGSARSPRPLKATSKGSPSIAHHRQTPGAKTPAKRTKHAPSSPDKRDTRPSSRSDSKANSPLKEAPAQRSATQQLAQAASPAVKDPIAEALRYTESNEAMPDTETKRQKSGKRTLLARSEPSASDDRRPSPRPNKPGMARDRLNSTEANIHTPMKGEANREPSRAPEAVTEQTPNETTGPTQRQDAPTQPSSTLDADSHRAHVRYTPDEDEALLDGIRAYGMGHWRLILNRIQDRLQMSHRTPQSLRKRAEQLGLQPERYPAPVPQISRSAVVRFTTEEDAELRKGIELFGYGSWALILKHRHFHPKRTTHSLKSRARFLKRNRLL